jgi:hypothetical protein
VPKAENFAQQIINVTKSKELKTASNPTISSMENYGSSKCFANDGDDDA